VEPGNSRNDSQNQSSSTKGRSYRVDRLAKRRNAPLHVLAIPTHTMLLAGTHDVAPLSI
jgi:hypothetical protein